MTFRDTILTAMVFISVLSTCPVWANTYNWQTRGGNPRCVASQIQAPAGCRRVEVEAGTFADWLRHLPLKRKEAPVHLYDGSLKANQGVHFAVVDIDTGARDLQQCADAVMRLRAEYLYSTDDFAAIHFNFTSGERASFVRWAAGYRPVVKGSRVKWVKQAAKDVSYSSFRSYLNTVFIYAGSYSLSRELRAREDVKNIQIGDVFIRGGFPGHAVIVVDVARNVRSGARLFLLAQSYMPAQEIHILKNPADAGLSPWYRIPSGETLETPEWLFKKSDLRYFGPENGLNR